MLYQKIIIIFFLFNLLIALEAQYATSDVDEGALISKDSICNRNCSLCEKDLNYCPKFDHCGCCQSCLRLYGEYCDVINLCDHKKQLICQIDESSDHGICKYNSPPIGGYSYVDKSEKICIFNGVVYQSSVRFSVSCRHRCQCNDGLVSCQDLCQSIEQSLPPPISICPNGAELIPPSENQCCREWSCKNDYSGIFAEQIANYFRKRTVTKKICQNKSQTSTLWSQCSKSCGMGISTRTSTNNLLCVNITEHRFCMYKHCPTKFQSLLQKIKPAHCNPTVRPANASKIEIHLENNHIKKTRQIICNSKRTFRPRLCNNCSECCRPIKSKTKRIEFHCSDNINRIIMYQWIKICSCDDNTDCK